MKKLIALFIALFIAIVFGFFIQKSTGYVMVVYQHWVVTTNIWVALITVLVAFLALYLLIRFFKNTAALPRKIALFSRAHRLHKKQQLLISAISDFTIGEYAAAEKKFIRAITRRLPTAFFYLAAAYSAQARDAISSRDKYLSRALQKSKPGDLAVALTEGALYLAHDEVEKALRLLTPLLAKNSNNKRLLRLLSDCFLQNKNWHKWLDLSSQLKKHAIFNDDKLFKLTITTYQQLLKSLLLNSDIAEFEKTWEIAPMAIKKDPAIIPVYLQYCHNYQPPYVGISFIESLLKKNWDKTLLLFYVHNDLHDKEALSQQLEMAQSWLKKHGDDATLLTVLAFLSIKLNFPGKATDYAKQALSKNIDSKTALLLADVFNQLGDKDQAIACYQTATSQ